MKKFIIGLAVLGTYGIYTIGIRHVRPVFTKPTLLTKSVHSTHSTTTKSTSTAVATSLYKNGNYIGSSEYEYYGNVQASVTISGGKITGVKFLQYPNSHSTSPSFELCNADGQEFY